MRKIYDRLGDAGVKTSEQSVVDHKHIIIQMLVGYASQVGRGLCLGLGLMVYYSILLTSYFVWSGALDC